MDIDLARHAIRIGFRCGRELEGLMAVLKAACGETEYKAHALAIATAINGIHEATVDRATAAHPVLEAELEAQVKAYGRYL